MDTPLPLSATDLTIGYTGKKQIKIAGPLHINFQEGNLYGLIGINGVGKSTLIKTLSGLLQPLKGEVKISGKDIFSLKHQERAKYISLVLTNSINAGLASVEDIVKMGRYPHTNWQFKMSNSDQRIIDNALDSVKIAASRNKLFAHLSDGNKQKVMIAKALAQDTDLMVLDEPTVHLDIKNRFIILELLQNLSKEHNKTILFSGHDLEYMLSFCDQIMLLTENGLVIKSPDAFIESGEITEAFELEKLQLQKLNFLK